ncbi:MAG: hypothetical protein KTV77_04390 [Wolbachia endosymbiont of Fragariocoptes setiger]|nr:hypothetical protein [Wolbachia endosymbiont of Fragariocoptes setiger]
MLKIKEKIRIFKKVLYYLLSKPKILREKQAITCKDLKQKFKITAKNFGQAATSSKHYVPKECQISIDLGNKHTDCIGNKYLYKLQNKFKNHSPRHNFMTEFGKNRQIFGTDIKVKHFTSDEQSKHSLYIDQKNDDFRLYDISGNLYNTKGKVSKGQQDMVAYAMTLEGKLVVHEHLDVGRCDELAFRHSTLGGGKAILCSGLIKIENGKITHIDNNSGHYKPQPANLYNAIKRLQKKNVFSSNAKIIPLTYGQRLLKEISFTNKIPIGKIYSVDKFIEEMEKVGKDKLAKHERHFMKVRQSNEKDKNKYRIVNRNYEPTPVSSNDNHATLKLIIEHSIRKITGANYGYKPKITLMKKNKNLITKIFGFSYNSIKVKVAFITKEDRNEFIEILQKNKLTYRKKGKSSITIGRNQMEKVLKDVLILPICIRSLT